MPNFRPLSATKFIDDANLVSYWKLDGNSLDETANNNDGTDTTITYTTGKFGQTSSLNGSSSKITIADASNLKPTSAFTISAWINKTNKNTTGVIFNSGAEQVNSPYNFSGIRMIVSSVGGLYAQKGSDTAAVTIGTTAGTQIDAGVWYHTVFTWDGTTMFLYLNGVLIYSQASSTTPVYQATNYVKIGCRALIGGGEDLWFGGLIDDTAIFSRALSASEVNELYQGMTLGEYLGAGSATTKLLLHLNGNSTDSSGNGNNGTDTNISYVDGKFGKCASFNGSSSKIQVSPAIASGSNFTASMWINGSTFAAKFLYDQRQSSNGYGLLDFIITSESKANIQFRDASLSNYTSITGNTVLSTGVWYNIVYTKSGTSVKIYINGNLDGSGTTNSTWTSTDVCYLGMTYNGSSYYTGAMDEFIIKNVAWSAEKVKKYYTNAKGRFATL